MTNTQELNTVSNFGSSRELVQREGNDWFPLKCQSDNKGALDARDIQLLDRFHDLMYERQEPLSVILMDKSNRPEGMPTFNMMRLLLEEKTTSDGPAFFNALKDDEYEIVWGSLWKQAKDGDDEALYKNKILMGLLGNKMKTLEKSGQVYIDNMTINNNNKLSDITDDVLLQAESMLKDQLKDCIDGEIVS
jgi:hypothetical protein